MLSPRLAPEGTAGIASSTHARLPLLLSSPPLSTGSLPPSRGAGSKPWQRWLRRAKPPSVCQVELKMRPKKRPEAP